MEIKFVDLKKQYLTIKEEVDNAIKDVIIETAFVKGKFVEEFEKNFADKLSVKYCIGVGNGTDALIVSLKALGIGKDDEVITAANTFIATSEAITACGAKVVFCDVDEKTYNIKSENIVEKITKKTKAIIPVHLYGQPADMKDILQLADKNNLFIIEDSAQAHFAEYFYNGNWNFAGTIGTLGTFSFYPGKNLGAYGDGGAIVTNDEYIEKKVRMYSNHGRMAKYDHEFEGINSRLDGLQAAILNVKLKFIKEWTEKRKRIAKLYSELLKDVGDIIIPFVDKKTKPVWHLYVIRTKKRDKLRKFLAEKGIATGIHYPIALPNLKAYQYLHHKKEDFPIASKLQEEILSLPIFPEMEDKEISYVVDCIKEFF